MASNGAWKPDRRQASSTVSWLVLTCGVLLTAANLLPAFRGVQISPLPYDGTEGEADRLQKVSASTTRTIDALNAASDELREAAAALVTANRRMAAVSDAVDSDPGEEDEEDASSAPTEWQSDNGIVHVVHTRYMQRQPKLYTLGIARFKLFQTFCLPTIRAQTNQQFLWIIRIDPLLDPRLRRKLLDLVRNVPNAVVVGSNQAHNGSKDGGFRSDTSIADVDVASLLHGEMNLLHSYRDAAKSHLLMEVNLDADDGLAPDFIERTEAETLKMVKNDDDWFVWCPKDVMEWHHYAPWNLNRDMGYLRPGSTNVCHASGLTWVSAASSEPKFVEDQTRIRKELSRCNGATAKGCWTWVQESNDIESNKKGLFSAIRTRTPASTGMEGVTVKAGEKDQDDVATDEHLWNRIGSFRLEKNLIKQTRKYMRDNMKRIVRDNLEGQCLEGQPCNEKAKDMLNAIEV